MGKDMKGIKVEMDLGSYNKRMAMLRRLNRKVREMQKVIDELRGGQKVIIRTITDKHPKRNSYSFAKDVCRKFHEAKERMGNGKPTWIISDDIFIEDAVCEVAKEWSRASAAIFEISIIRKALNFGQDMHLTKDPKNSCIYYPSNPFVTNDSTYYSSEINSGIMEVIGKIKSEGKEYNILGDIADTTSGGTGLGQFSYEFGDGGADADVGFLGCATEEIAKHFSKYFGMLITEAKYGDLPDFEIIERKYN